MTEEPKRIFSGDESREFWNAINSLKGKNQEVLYWFGCKCQELEALVCKLQDRIAELERSADGN